jgi:hypothetical protein
MRNEDITIVIGDRIYSLKLTNTFVTEDGWEYTDHTKHQYMVEVYSPNDLDYREKVYRWGGLEPTYVPTHAQAVVILAKELLWHAESAVENEEPVAEEPSGVPAPDAPLFDVIKYILDPKAPLF